MFDFHEKRKIRSFLYSKFVIGGLFLVAILLSFSVYDRYLVAGEMKLKLEERRTQLQEIKSRAQVLESKVQYFENDRGIEEELRNRFDVAKEGEQVVVLIDPKKNEEGEKEDSIQKESVKEQTKEGGSFFDFLGF